MSCSTNIAINRRCIRVRMSHGRSMYCMHYYAFTLSLEGMTKKLICSLSCFLLEIDIVHVNLCTATTWQSSFGLRSVLLPVVYIACMRQRDNGRDIIHKQTENTEHKEQFYRRCRTFWPRESARRLPSALLFYFL